MAALIMSMAQSMQISEIADMIGEHDTRVWRVVKYYAEDARSREDFSDVSIIGIDETSSAKGHKYVTLVMVFATSKVIHVCRGKDALTLSTFKEDHYDIPSIESLKVKVPTTHMK